MGLSLSDDPFLTKLLFRIYFRNSGKVLQLVRPLYRSRSLKRIYRRVPSGETVIHYEKRKNTPMRCSRCGAILAGVPIKDRERRKLPKTAKRPERMFGGVLCSRCLRIVLKKVIRTSIAS